MSSPLEVVPVGIRNAGNTCFLNSVLQVLRVTPAFLHSLQEYDQLIADLFHMDNLVLSNTDACKLVLVRHLHCFYMDARAAVKVNYDGMDAAHVRTALIKVNDMFDGYEQHDAQEALSCILDAVDTAHRLITVHFQHRPLPAPLFDGQAKVVTRCVQCEQHFHSAEPFTCLGIPLKRQAERRSVPVLEERGNASVSEDEETPMVIEEKGACWMLNAWSLPVLLSGDNKYRCSQCMALTEAQQQHSLASTSTILMFHLKRFAAWSDEAETAARPKKIMDPFPTHLSFRLKFEQKIAEDADRFVLYAVVIHRGRRLGGGHYFAFVRAHAKGRRKRATQSDQEEEEKEDQRAAMKDETVPKVWFKCDDSSVIRIEELEEELRRGTIDTTYLLLYHRVCAAVL